MNDGDHDSSPNNAPDLFLHDGSEIAVIGGGPSGSFFTYFLLDIARRIGRDIHVNVYEEKDFSRLGPMGCNHCGGIISESLVQMLSAEGIVIPEGILQRGIESYTLHMDVGTSRIETPSEEKRIAAVFRGGGPFGTQTVGRGGFDDYLLKLGEDMGAVIIRDRVERIDFDGGRPRIKTRGDSGKSYDLVVGAVGLKESSLRFFEDAGNGYHPPGTTKTYICEFSLGPDIINQYFGNSMHVFLLNIPRLEFAALIPKGEFVTLVMLGHKIDKDLVATFLRSPEVKQCFPPDWNPNDRPSCQCFPSINIRDAKNPFADRLVLIGDCATSKLYKNGIGAAYLASKTAATTALFHGISREDFRKHYLPLCKKISFDNLIGKGIFLSTGLIQKTAFSKRGIHRMILKEHTRRKDTRRLSMVFWDTFTGSATYKNILIRMMHPLFFLPLMVEIAAGFFSKTVGVMRKKGVDDPSALGKLYRDGGVVIRQGDEGDCMYVIQSGAVDVLQEKNGREVFLAELKERDFFGEMALFEREVRSATIRSRGESRILTVDKKMFLGRIQDDPLMAFRIVEKMSSRIRKLNAQLSRIKAMDRRNWDTRCDEWESEGKV